MIQQSKPMQLLALLAAFVVFCGHEFWVRPERYRVEPGQQMALQLFVGEGFQGEERPFKRQRVERFEQVQPSGAKVDIAKRAFADSLMPAAAVRLTEPGTHVFAYHSKPTFIALKAADFNAYLEEDGLDNIKALRHQQQQTGKDGRELYVRCAKTLVQAGGTPTASATQRVGLPLELTPIQNPYSQKAGGYFTFELTLRGKPLEFARVVAWHRGANGLTRVESRSDARGRVTFQLGAPGEWMVSAVWMEPTAKADEADYQSWWANLTFEVGQ